MIDVRQKAYYEELLRQEREAAKAFRDALEKERTARSRCRRGVEILVMSPWQHKHPDRYTINHWKPHPENHECGFYHCRRVGDGFWVDPESAAAFARGLRS